MTRRLMMFAAALVAAIATIAPAGAFQKCKKKLVCDQWKVTFDVNNKPVLGDCMHWYTKTVCDPQVKQGPTPLKPVGTLQTGSPSPARDPAVTRLPASGAGPLEGAGGSRDARPAATGSGRVGR